MRVYIDHQGDEDVEEQVFQAGGHGGNLSSFYSRSLSMMLNSTNLDSHTGVERTQPGLVRKRTDKVTYFHLLLRMF